MFKGTNCVWWRYRMTILSKNTFLFIFTFEYNRINRRFIDFYILNPYYGHVHVCAYFSLENDKTQNHDIDDIES